jgi:hypothetical protein
MTVQEPSARLDDRWRHDAVIATFRSAGRASSPVSGDNCDGHQVTTAIVIERESLVALTGSKRARRGCSYVTDGGRPTYRP